MLNKVSMKLAVVYIIVDSHMIFDRNTKRSRLDFVSNRVAATEHR